MPDMINPQKGIDLMNNKSIINRILFDRVNSLVLVEHSKKTKHHICIEDTSVDHFLKRHVKEAMLIVKESDCLNRDDSFISLAGLGSPFFEAILMVPRDKNFQGMFSMGRLF
jgi:hypothetical protein